MTNRFHPLLTDLLGALEALREALLAEARRDDSVASAQQAVAPLDGLIVDLGDFLAVPSSLTPEDLGAVLGELDVVLFPVGARPLGGLIAALDRTRAPSQVGARVSALLDARARVQAEIDRARRLS